MPFPLIFTGPAESAPYFSQIHAFIGETLGGAAQERYQVIIDDPVAVSQAVQDGIRAVREYRKSHSDAYYFNWRLKIDEAFQKPFIPTHASMRSLSLHKQQEPHALAANLRCVFSGVVAGNVKIQGIAAIEKNGPFEIHGQPDMMESMDALLAAFVEQNRMKLPGMRYQPCYRIIK